MLVDPGTEYRRGSETPRIDEHGFVVLIPDDGWWSAYFNAVPRAQHGHLVYVDINTVATWVDDTVHLVDLDLDVVMDGAGAVTIIDHDEFEAHQSLYSYPDDVIEATRGAADAVARMMSDGTEPFSMAGPSRVAEHLSWATGRVVTGHGVASAASSDPRFPNGTLALQFPHFRAAGIPVDDMAEATLNVRLPAAFEPRSPDYRLVDLEWLDGYPPETFDFFSARVAHRGVVVPGLVYRPDPATKPEFHQPDDVVEVLAPRLDGVAPGTPLSVWIDPAQGRFVF